MGLQYVRIPEVWAETPAVRNRARNGTRNLTRESYRGPKRRGDGGAPALLRAVGCDRLVVGRVVDPVSFERVVEACLERSGSECRVIQRTSHVGDDAIRDPGNAA